MIPHITIILLSISLIACKGLPSTNSQQREQSSHAPADSSSDLNHVASIVFQDSKGNFWFSSKGAVKFDGATYTRFTTKDGLQSNRIHTIKEDHLGNIYFDTGEGISKYDGSIITQLKVVDNSSKAMQLHSTDLWFAGDWNMNGVYRCDGEYLYPLRLSNHPFEKEFLTSNPNPSYSPYSVYTTYIDENGHLWMGGAIFGACRFDGKSFFWISEREMTEMDPGPAMGIRAIDQDAQGNFYFGSNVNSKYRMIENDGKVSYQKLKGVDTSEDPAIMSACISMVIDQNDHIWMAHYKAGVWKYDGEKFTHFPILHEGEEAELFSTFLDNKETVWLGTHNAGAFYWNGETFQQF